MTELISPASDVVSDVLRSFDTDAAFAKAFKRRFGVSPGTYRQTAKEPPKVEIARVRP